MRRGQRVPAECCGAGTGFSDAVRAGGGENGAAAAQGRAVFFRVLCRGPRLLVGRDGSPAGKHRGRVDIDCGNYCARRDTSKRRWHDDGCSRNRCRCSINKRRNYYCKPHPRGGAFGFREETNRAARAGADAGRGFEQARVRGVVRVRRSRLGSPDGARVQGSRDGRSPRLPVRLPREKRLRAGQSARSTPGSSGGGRRDLRGEKRGSG
mmetsp:Transcript_21135/g.53283  ORF Transcript_21135/g.53283 Transcript_21135/m.53283 type:complete len:209 (+) Transcript_21135:572-1198(+)